jgi:hypothetical protein
MQIFTRWAPKKLSRRAEEFCKCSSKERPEGTHKTKRAAPGVQAPNAALTKVPTGEATMAANELTKKLLIYHTLYRLNVSFANVIAHCQTFRNAGMLTARQLKLFRGYTKELQAEINEGVLGPLHDKELKSWHRFGKIREAEEKRLREPADLPANGDRKKVKKK